MRALVFRLACRRFRAQHLAYLDGTLDAGDQAAAEQHVLACDACAAHDTLVRRAILLARNVAVVRPSAAFRDRLMERLAVCRAERSAMGRLHLRS